jgi:hypothetical protein
MPMTKMAGKRQTVVPNGMAPLKTRAEMRRLTIGSK